MPEMKKILLCFSLLILTFVGCNSGDDNPQNPIALCGNVSDFTVTQQNEMVLFQLSSNTNPLYYEISATLAQNDSPNSGTVVILNSPSGSFSANDLNMIPGYTYKIYVRSACSDVSKSAWSSPKIFNFNDYCGSPTDLHVALYTDGKGFTWQPSDSDNAYYQLSYGPQGFDLASSTPITLNANYYVAPMNANTAYDFYVRSYCTSATGWSSWSGPFTYFNEGGQGLCTQPSNVHFTPESSTSANFTWDYNGESHFEYALVGPSQTINSVTIYSIGNTTTPTYLGLSSSITYTFYVRAVCSNGNRTPWATISVDL